MYFFYSKNQSSCLLFNIKLLRLQLLIWSLKHKIIIIMNKKKIFQNLTFAIARINLNKKTKYKLIDLLIAFVRSYETLGVFVFFYKINI